MTKITQDEEATKQEVGTLIRKIAGTEDLDVVTIVNCTVVSVDKDARTCIVQALSGRSDTQIENVGLSVERNDGEFKIPSVDSTVGVVMSTLVDPYIIGWSDLDEWYIVIGSTTINVLEGEIKFGDGSFDGLGKIAEITDKLNNLENKVNGIINTFNSHTHPYVNVTAPATTSPSSSPVVGTLTPTVQSEIENEKILHGII